MSEPEFQKTKDGVRLVGKEEAEAAIESGKVVSRRTKEEPVIITEDEQILDIRVVAPAHAQTRESSSTQGDEQTTLLPHWTEPPSGEVMIGGQDEPSVPQPRWRDRNSDWNADDLSFDDLNNAIHNEEIHLNEIPSFELSSENDPEIPFDFSKSLEEVAKEEAAPSSDEKLSSEDTSTPAAKESLNKEQSSEPTNKKSSLFDLDVVKDAKEKAIALKSKGLVTRVATGGAFALAALVAFIGGPVWLLVMSAVVMTLAAVELYDALRTSGYRPATILGLLSVVGVIFGAYAKGEAAIPLILFLSVGFTFLWYLTGIIKNQPTVNIAATLLGVLWVGVFASFAALLLRMPNEHGLAFLWGALLCTIAYDTTAYLAGNIIGRRTLAPSISPGKTWEGLIAGTVVSLLVGGLIAGMIHPWTFGSGLLLGLVVAVAAPIGDLAESMIKRDLKIKDMGHILPGHGGLLDRFDALLFVLPATYYLVTVLNIA